MEWMFFLFGLLPYLLEMYLLTYSLKYSMPKPVYKERPFVSVQVPAYREPPGVLLETLHNLKAQTYHQYEVLVLVNNTSEEEYKRPIREYCRKVGKPFVYHDLQVEGYKGGTLNVALELMDKKAEVVCIVDSDYKVRRNFLERGVSYLEERVGVVQFPQDYRDFPEKWFHKAMYLSYRYFFAVIMRMCHVLNAVCFMGTVGFIKKEALKSAGRWSQRVLTEDSEMGLRILKAGYRGVYVDQSVGKGLMAFSFYSCRKQRFRWAFGNAQTILKHLYSLTFGRKLTLKQKAALWVQNTVWHTPLFFSSLLTFLSFFFAPLGYLGVGLLLGFLVSRTYSFMWLYRKIDHLSVHDAFSALIFYLSLFFPMSLAPLKALTFVHIPFYRTPKEKVKEEENYSGEAFCWIIFSAFGAIYFFAGNIIFLLMCLLYIPFLLSFAVVMVLQRRAFLEYSPLSR